MTKFKAFDYGLCKIQSLLNSSVSLKALCLGGTMILAACETTDVQRQTQLPGPVISAPQLPDLPELPPEETKPQEQAPQNTQVNSQQGVTPQTIIQRNGITPPHMAGRDIKRVAIILPFSAKSERLRAEAASMFRAAELAIFNRPEADTLLVALDSQGNEQGARQAVQSAVRSGVDVILGPVLSKSVAAAGREARKANIPVIAFSTDQKVAGNGTYLLSFPPEAEVRRVIDYARGTGISRFAYLGPDNRYGRRVFDEYGQHIARTGGELTATESYRGNDITVMDAPARRLSAAFKEIQDANELKEEEGLPPDPLAFEAIILPEGGTALRSLAPLLLYYEDGISDVQFLGTGLWNREETVREPALNGGIFAGPDKEAQRGFLLEYDRSYGEEPSRLASLAYDAVNFGVFVADGDPRGRRARAEDPQGFYGSDGLVRFNRDGTPDRGLAVYQIRNGRFVVVDPAPRQTTGGF